VAGDLSDDVRKPDPVIESMPEASTEPVSTVSPLVAGPGVEHSTYKGRFALVYGILGAILAAAAVFFAYVLIEGAAPKGQAWSTWRPAGGERLDMASEIAAHVGPLYHIAPGGDQLVTVQAKKAEVQSGSDTIPVEEVALKGGSDYQIHPTADSVEYVLCGLGSRCSIAKGTPSVERARLLRREALELALYTFKYVDGVDSVIALIPPPANDPNTNWALFFQKKNFEEQLSKPLSHTLPTPPTGKKLVPADVLDNQDAQLIEKLTKPYWFTSQYQPLQDGNAILVLDPVIAAR
jgi:hypothetical protein